MYRKLAPLFIAGGLVLVASGCAAPYHARLDTERTSVSGDPSTKMDLAKLIYQAAQTITDRAVYLDKTRPIIAATIVSVDDLNHSSTFGRLASQLTANRIQQRGYLVRDVTYMRALELQSETGELVLTREASKVSTTINAQAVIAGTYAVAGKEIYLNLRLLNAAGGEILASADVVIPLDENTDALFDHGFATKTMLSFSQFEDLAHEAQKDWIQ